MASTRHDATAVTRTQKAIRYEKPREVNRVQEKIVTTEACCRRAELLLSIIQDRAHCSKPGVPEVADSFQAVDLVGNVIWTDCRKTPSFQNEGGQSKRTSYCDLVRKHINDFRRPVRRLVRVDQNRSEERFQFQTFVEPAHGSRDEGEDIDADVPSLPKLVNLIERDQHAGVIASLRWVLQQPNGQASAAAH